MNSEKRPKSSMWWITGKTGEKFIDRRGMAPTEHASTRKGRGIFAKDLFLTLPVNQVDDRYFGRGQESNGRSPCACPPAHTEI